MHDKTIGSPRRADKRICNINPEVRRQASLIIDKTTSSSLDTVLVNLPENGNKESGVYRPDDLE